MKQLQPKALALALALALAPGLAAADRAPDHYNATVKALYDADTLTARVPVWIDLVKEPRIRVRGIDSPERGKPKCRAERMIAWRAIGHTREWFKRYDGRIRLFRVRNGKYGGRFVAGVSSRDGESWLADYLIKHGAGRWYSGRGKRKGWCR